MKYLYLMTLGAVEQDITHDLSNALNSLGPFRFIAEDNYPSFAFNPKRKQYYARKIIDDLSMHLPEDCMKIIAVTDVDLCTPVLTYVFGEAELDGHAAVVSLKRLKQEFYYLPSNRALFIKRLIKVCIHELGHCYGLVHCNNAKCVMHLSNSIAGIDEKPKDFCGSCNVYFEKKIRMENDSAK